MYHSLKGQEKRNSFSNSATFLCVYWADLTPISFFNQSFPPVAGTAWIKNWRESCVTVSEGFFLNLIVNSLVLFRWERKRSGFHIRYEDLCADTGQFSPECRCWLGDLHQLKGDTTSSENSLRSWGEISWENLKCSLGSNQIEEYISHLHPKLTFPTFFLG